MNIFELILTYTNKIEKYHYTDIVDAMEAYYYYRNAMGNGLIDVKLKQ